jgi:DNA-directed RNA polymerase alpha subunit
MSVQIERINLTKLLSNDETPIEEIFAHDLSVRARNAIRNADSYDHMIKTIGELVRLGERRWLRWPNFGIACAQNVWEALGRYHENAARHPKPWFEFAF